MPNPDRVIVTTMRSESLGITSTALSDMDIKSIRYDPNSPYYLKGIESVKKSSKLAFPVGWLDTKNQ